jgi:3(or 17)beta-hydroxysteroid dehydrogenase
MNILENKIALVTGGGSGIGEKICELFLEKGATVICADISYKSNLHFKNIGEKNEVHLDVTRENQWKQLQQKIKETYSCLDIIVNSAGISGYSSNFKPLDLENYSLKYWKNLFSINLEGVLLACKYGIPLMRRSSQNNIREGSIINLASRAADIGIPGGEAYAASKAGVVSLTKSVAMYCATKNYKIRCNSISPDFVDTPLLDFLLGEGETRKDKINKLSVTTPMKEIIRPIEVAQLALFLASNEARLINGTNIIIDGGVSAGIINNLFVEGIN